MSFHHGELLDSFEASKSASSCFSVLSCSRPEAHDHKVGRTHRTQCHYVGRGLNLGMLHE